MVARALWALLAALRAGWCLLPQSGYLHPDEFFQAPEVMAGKACARRWVAPRGLEGTRSGAATRAPCPASPARRVFPRDPALSHGESRKPGRTGSAGLAGWVGSCSVLSTARGAWNHITVTCFSMLCKNEWDAPKNAEVDTSFKSLGAALYCDTSYTK